MAKTVLLVEDEDNIAAVLEILVQRAGHVSRRLRSGKDAVDDIRTDPPDLVLLDVMLPGCMGDEVCRRVRRDPALDAVKIVLMSAAHDAARRTRDCGADAFIAKPFANEAVQSAIGRLLGPEQEATS